LDRYSLRSHELANEARNRGLFDAEIVPLPITNDAGETVWFSEDEGIRPDTSMEKLSALAPAFEGLGVITAGNASQISDGASATLVMNEQTCMELGLRPRARFVSFAVVGVDPVTMLKGPIPATGKVLQRAGLRVEDIDLFEINEAFAPVVLAWQKEWDVPWEKVNVHGGAIALGHPLGATGTRITATLLNALEQRQKRYGLIAICEGGGMANAVIIERMEP
jgi:acetyl-CoA acyltransferase